MDWVSSTFGQITLLCASWSVVTGSVWKLCERLEKVASAEAKSHLARWLSNAAVSDSVSFADAVRLAFVTVFGSKHFTWFCVQRSLLASCALFSAFFLLWLAVTPEEDLAFLWTFRRLVATLALVVIINGAVDYVSLLKARWLLRWRIPSPAWSMTALVVDFIVSLLLGCLGFVIGASIEASLELPFLQGFPWHPFDAFAFVAQQESGRLIESPNEFLSLTTESNWHPPPAVWVYTTCMTSVWAALLAVSALIVKGAVAANNVLSIGKRLLDLQEYPFLALAAMAILVITVVYAVVGLYVTFL